MLFLGSQEVAPNSYAPEAGLKRGIADSLKLAYALYIDGTRTKNAGGGLLFAKSFLMRITCRLSPDVNIISVLVR